PRLLRCPHISVFSVCLASRHIRASGRSVNRKKETPSLCPQRLARWARLWGNLLKFGAHGPLVLLVVQTNVTSWLRNLVLREPLTTRLLTSQRPLQKHALT